MFTTVHHVMQMYEKRRAWSQGSVRDWHDAHTQLLKAMSTGEIELLHSDLLLWASDVARELDARKATA